MISFDNVEFMSEKKNYNQSNIILGVLLEGFLNHILKIGFPKIIKKN